jgi:hypothetical protein
MGKLQRRGAALIIALLLGAPGAARAEDPMKAQLAQALFDEAKKLMAEKNFADACPKLVESQRLDPSGGTLLHLGICHASQGKTGSAYTELNEALSAARRDGRADRESVAAAHLAALSPKLVRLTVTVGAPARVPSLVVSWNGTALPEAQWGVAFAVDPGAHVITASAPGRRTWTGRVEAVADGTRGPIVEVPVLEIAAAPAPVVAPREPQAERSAETSSGSAQRTLGLGLGIAGIIGLGIGGAFELRSLSLASQRDDDARAGLAEGVADKQASAKSSQLVAAIVGGLGAVALGTGAVLFFTAPSARSSTAIAPWVGPSSGGLVFGGRL